MLSALKSLLYQSKSITLQDMFQTIQLRFVQIKELISSTTQSLEIRHISV
jgi:hypothetical protein